MTVSLTTAEADAKMQQIFSHTEDAARKLGQIRDAQDSMLSRSWGGGSANSYSTTSQEHSQEFDMLIADLRRIADEGATHIQKITSADNG
jgi:uncharacterized protein YukE